tara:strand:+ start:167 stop:1771 length:1605 start_codon:yes stop_codon:yes gene_type:complete
MSTRGQIAIRKPDGEINSVYSHSDNYIQEPGNGDLLIKYYTDEDEIKQLIYGGNISSLGKSINSTRYYARDMGRKGEGFETFKDEEDWIENSNFKAVQYNYLYDLSDSEWYVSTPYHSFPQNQLIPLLIAIEGKLAKGGKIINNKNMSEHEQFNKGGRQGYNDKLDESLAMRRGRKRQNYKDRRDESKGTERSRLRRDYSSVSTMDRFNSPYRLARGGNSHNDSMSMLRKYDVRSPYGTYSKGGRPKKAQGGDIYSGSRLNKAGDSNFTFSGDNRKGVYTGRDVTMMAAKGGDIVNIKKEIKELSDYYDDIEVSGVEVYVNDYVEDEDVSSYGYMFWWNVEDQECGIEYQNTSGSQESDDPCKTADDFISYIDQNTSYAKGGDVYTGRNVSMMAAKGKLVPSLHPTHKEVLQLMSLPEVEAQEYIIGQKDLIIKQLKDKMQDIHEFAELALQGDNFALEQIESISDHARFNEGGEVYSGSKLADAGNTDFSFTGKSESNETYTGKDISMMAARGKSLKKVKKASKGGEAGIGMF